MANIEKLMKDKAFTQVIGATGLEALKDKTLDDLYNEGYITDGSFYTVTESTESTEVNATEVTESTEATEVVVEDDADAPVVDEE